MEQLQERNTELELQSKLTKGDFESDLRELH